MAQMDVCGKKLAREGDPEASVQSQAIGGNCLLHVRVFPRIASGPKWGLLLSS